MFQGGSQAATEDVDDARHRWGVPLDRDGTIHVVVPVAATTDVQATVGLLHDDAIGYVLEVLIDVGDGLENLRWPSAVPRHR